MTTRLFIPGEPKSTQTGSVVVVKRRGQKPRLMPLRRNQAWAEHCRWIAQREWGAPCVPRDVPVSLCLTFSLRRPKRGTRLFPTTRPDGDDLSKGLLDSFQGTIYADDAQITELIIRKRYAEGGAVGVLVEAQTEAGARPGESP